MALTVAGRTDAGVHAWAQVASHEGEAAPLGSLNALLPPDVAVVASESVADGFDARRDCTSRAYCYRVLARPARSALERGHALHWSYPVDFAKLLQSAPRCWSARTTSPPSPRPTPTTCASTATSTRPTGAGRGVDHDLLEFWIEADTFMRHMNRTLVGTMLESRAAGSRSATSRGCSEARRAPAAGPTAPAHGLYFAGAGYRGERLLSPPGLSAISIRFSSATCEPSIETRQVA